MRSLLFFFLIFSLGGCVSLSRTEEDSLRSLRSYGVSEDEVKVKNPGLAGGLNFLPGVGNFYLASGTTESSQWTYGFLNLLSWPLSIVWAIPQAAIDANVINKRETVYYYFSDRKGVAEFEKIKQSKDAPQDLNNKIPLNIPAPKYQPL